MCSNVTSKIFHQPYKLYCYIHKLCEIANQVTVNKCTNGDVRLVNGNKDNEGRVEYCYNGQWSPMCSLSTYTARLVCKELGYKKYNCKMMNM